MAHMQWRVIFRWVPVILWVHIFTEINPNSIVEQKECGGLFHRHVTTVSNADESRLAESANLYVVRYLTGSDQRYDRDKLSTWSNAVPTQHLCRQKNNKMRSEIKRWVTPTSTDTVPPRILLEKQNSLLWVAQATEVTSLTTRGASWSEERNCTICIHMLLVRSSSANLRQVIHMLYVFWYSIFHFPYTLVPPLPWVIRPNTYRW